jgi:hypothetical protein
LLIINGKIVFAISPPRIGRSERKPPFFENAFVFDCKLIEGSAK